VAFKPYLFLLRAHLSPYIPDNALLSLISIFIQSVLSSPRFSDSALSNSILDFPSMCIFYPRLLDNVLFSPISNPISYPLESVFEPSTQVVRFLTLSPYEYAFEPSPPLSPHLSDSVSSSPIFFFPLNAHLSSHLLDSALSSPILSSFQDISGQILLPCKLYFLPR
jgi:hypothetical protein